MPSFSAFYTQKCKLYTKKCKVFLILRQLYVNLHVKLTLFYFTLYMSSGLWTAVQCPFPATKTPICKFCATSSKPYDPAFSRKWSLKSVSPDRVPYAIFSRLLAPTAILSLFPKVNVNMLDKINKI